MDWITGMQRAIDYIEAHLTEDISYERVAAESFSSSYHFQRVFSILCGYTLGEYIRLRRLSLAGADGSMLKSFSRLSIKISLEGGNTMNYRIEEKPEMILTGFKRHFSGVPGERGEQEEQLYLTTRPLQYILKGLAGDLVTGYDVITGIGDDGYDFYIAGLLDECCREHLAEDGVLGEGFAGYFENITIPKGTYAIFETERCAYPTDVFLELRRRIAGEWLPTSGYRLAQAPELVVTHWYTGERRDERYRELWIPIEKK